MTGAARKLSPQLCLETINVLSGDASNALSTEWVNYAQESHSSYCTAGGDDSHATMREAKN